MPGRSPPVSTTPVTDTRVTVSDRPVPNQSVVAELGGVVDGSWRVLEGRAADGHVVGRERVFTDAAGHWVLPLIPNSEIAPTGTTYRLTEPSGQHFIIVPVAQIDADGKPIPVSAGDLYTVDPPQPVMPLPGQGPAGPPFVVKGDVANQAALPSTGVPGQGWVTSDTGHVWAWDPAVPGWVDAGQFQGTPGVGLEYQWTGDQLEVRPQGSTGAWSPSPHLTGTPGTDGTDGTNGADGTGIASAAVDGAGDLTLTLTDTTTLGPWHVAGQNGTAATVAIDPTSGSVPHGTPTSVVNTGTAAAAILKFLIEQAADGAPGSQILTGTGTPTGTPPDGSLMLDTGNGNVWRYSGGAWSGAPVLNIMGPAGNPTAFELRGSGSPYGTIVPTSAGIYYTDTAATNGAIRWVSTGTTNTSWIVTVGDTGWRTVMVSTTPGWQGVQVFLRRTADTVHLKLVSTGTAAVTNVYTLPTGFRSTGIPGGGSDAWSGPRPGSGGSASFSIASFSVIGYDGGTAFATAHPVYPTTDPWPTTLPGTPA